MTEPRLRLEIDASDSGLVLRGEIDAHTAIDLASHLDPLPGSDGDVCLDVSEVEFIDSSGLRVLVDAHRRAGDHGRRLVLRQPSHVVTRLLEISGLTGHLAVSEG